MLLVAFLAALWFCFMAARIALCSAAVERVFVQRLAFDVASISFSNFCALANVPARQPSSSIATCARFIALLARSFMQQRLKSSFCICLMHDRIFCATFLPFTASRTCVVVLWHAFRLLSLAACLRHPLDLVTEIVVVARRWRYWVTTQRRATSSRQRRHATRAC